MDQFRQMTAKEIAAYRRGTYRPTEPRQTSARERSPRYSIARPVRGSNGNKQDLPSWAGSDRSDKLWRRDPLWKCAVKGCDHLAPTASWLSKTFHALAPAPACRIVSCFEGYRCPLQPCSAHNPEPAMVRRHTKRHLRGEAGWERALTAICSGRQSGDDGPWGFAQVPTESAVRSSTS